MDVFQVRSCYACGVAAGYKEDGRFFQVGEGELSKYNYAYIYILCKNKCKNIHILWGYAHASPQNCLFWGPGFGTSFTFWSNIAPASCYFIVSFPWLAEFAASIILFEDAKCEIAALSITCGLHMILSQDEELSGSCSSFHAKPI